MTGEARAPRMMRTLLSVAPEGIDGLSLSDLPIEDPPEGQVRLRVRACGLSFPDLLMLRDMYQVKPPRPFTPGTEVAGIVDSVGAGVAHFRLGDRLFAGVPWGGMAEYVNVPVTECYRMPDSMTFEEAAGFLSSYGTAYHALVQRACLAQGERLLVLGAGSGVGVAVVQLGKALGAHVIAAASTTEKLCTAISQGADETVLYSGGTLDAAQMSSFTEQLKAIAPAGVNVICDIIGGAYTEAALRAIAWEGRLLIIGFPAGIPKLPMNLPLLKGCQIVGVFYGAYIQRNPQPNKANISHLLKLYEDGMIAPLISGRFPLDRAAEAFQALEQRRIAGKIVITPMADSIQ